MGVLETDPLIESEWVNKANHGIRVRIIAPFSPVNGYTMYRIRTIENDVVPEAVGICVVARLETLERDWELDEAA